MLNKENLTFQFKPFEDWGFRRKSLCSQWKTLPVKQLIQWFSCNVQHFNNSVDHSWRIVVTLIQSAILSQPLTCADKHLLVVLCDVGCCWHVGPHSGVHPGSRTWSSALLNEPQLQLLTTSHKAKQYSIISVFRMKYMDSIYYLTKGGVSIATRYNDEIPFNKILSTLFSLQLTFHSDILTIA